MRGQIWLCSLYNKGSVQTGFRPVVIISNNKCNIHSSVLTVIPVTSKVKDFITHVRLDLELPSVAMCEQIQSVNKWQLNRCIGKVTEEELSKIDKKIKLQLGVA